MIKQIKNRIADEWAKLDPVDPLRDLLSDVLEIWTQADQATVLEINLSRDEAERLLDDIYRGIGCLSYATAESGHARDSLVDALRLISARLAQPEPHPSASR